MDLGNIMAHAIMAKAINDGMTKFHLDIAEEDGKLGVRVDAKISSEAFATMLFFWCDSDPRAKELLVGTVDALRNIDFGHDDNQYEEPESDDHIDDEIRDLMDDINDN